MLNRKVKSDLFCYTAEQVGFIWPQVEPHIQRALDRGSNYSLEDIKDGLIASKMQLWCWQSDVIEAALVTSIQEKNGIKFCLYLALGGSKMDEWAKFMPLVEEWARSEGCQEMRVYGRAGWAKAFNFKIEYTKMTRQLWDQDR